MEKNIDREFRARNESADSLSALAAVGCVLPPFVVMGIGVFLTDRVDILILIIVILELMLLAAALIFNSSLCIVNANKNNVTIKNILCRNVVSVKTYEYSDIEKAECYVEQFKSRYGISVSYGMRVKIMLKSGKALKYGSGLKISNNLHKDDPKLYRRLVEDEEMFKLCAFINDIKAKQNNDGNMQ